MYCGKEKREEGSEKQKGRTHAATHGTTATVLPNASTPRPPPLPTLIPNPVALSAELRFQLKPRPPFQFLSDVPTLEIGSR